MLNRILEEILAHSKEAKAVIGIRKYNGGNDMYVGYIINYNANIFVLQHITKYGLPDGLIIEKMEDIESVETDDDYVKAYQFLSENHDKIQKQAVDNISLPFDENWQYELLNSKFDNGNMITIELNNSDLVVHGFVIDFDETHLKFHPIDKLGKDEGISIYRLSDISGFTIDTLESRKRQAFYDWINRSQLGMD